jgi:hypothetical protein
MLFKREALDGIAGGKVTLAFRRWKRATVKGQGRVRTAAGIVRLGRIDIVGEADISAADADAAGFATREALMEMLAPDNGNPIYRIELQGLERDGRAALRDAATPTDDEWKAIETRFARWERDAPGYFPAILAAIAERPEVAAAELASAAGVEKLEFKKHVRKLKELGLTESLDVGYRLSPRGETVLRWLRGRKPPTPLSEKFGAL